MHKLVAADRMHPPQPGTPETDSLEELSKQVKAYGGAVAAARLQRYNPRSTNLSS